jgi:hypothetical protein
MTLRLSQHQTAQIGQEFTISAALGDMVLLAS